MTILTDVLSELFGMFVGDARLSAAILVVVAAAAGTIRLTGASPLAGGALLLLGCLAVMIGAVLRAARLRARTARAERTQG